MCDLNCLFDLIFLIFYFLFSEAKKSMIIDFPGDGEFNQEPPEIETGVYEIKDRYYSNAMNDLKTSILTDRELENDSLELDGFLENTAPAEEDHSYSFDISDDIKHYDTSESESVNSNENKEETVIFQGSKLTISRALVLILSFSIRFSLSSTALSNLLSLIHLMLPKSSNLRKT